MTRERLYRLLGRRQIQIIPLALPQDIQRVWSLLKKVRNPRYTKTAFLSNMQKKGFNAIVKDQNGEIEAAWLSRGVNIKGEDGAWVEMTYHNGSRRGLMALAYLSFHFWIALKKDKKVWYYSTKNPWKGAKKIGGEYYEFDKNRIGADKWAAAAVS